MDKKLKQILAKSLQDESSHISIEEEFAFYRQIQQGDMQVLEGNLCSDPTEGMGVLSHDPLRNRKYHLIVMTAMITRFCVEGGLDTETAYTMSDYYIRLIDSAHNNEQLSDLKKEIIYQYTLTMQQRKKQGLYSLPVTKACEYIRGHITAPLTVKEIAEALQYSPDHLSRLFKQETGFCLSRYILMQKCQSACYILENSSASCTDISALLGFSSCSHFVSRFKSIMQMTPQEYRKSTARQAFSGSLPSSDTRN